jgi:hypothetical protein
VAQNQMKIVCPITIGGVEQTKTLTTATGVDVGSFVKTKPGLGKPFLAFNTLPGTVTAADFDGAPIVDADAAVNNAAITTMLADPQPYLDRLTFA